VVDVLPPQPDQYVVNECSARMDKLDDGVASLKAGTQVCASSC